MLWLEMSRDEAHGGGSWAFGQSLWSPSRKTNDTKWAFWDTLLHVEAGDPVLHLRGKGDRATFVAFSTAAADGFETSDRPHNPGAWSFARSYYCRHNLVDAHVNAIFLLSYRILSFDKIRGLHPEPERQL